MVRGMVLPSNEQRPSVLRTTCTGPNSHPCPLSAPPSPRLTIDSTVAVLLSVLSVLLLTATGKPLFFSSRLGASCSLARLLSPCLFV